MRLFGIILGLVLLGSSSYGASPQKTLVELFRCKAVKAEDEAFVPELSIFTTVEIQSPKLPTVSTLFFDSYFGIRKNRLILPEVPTTFLPKVAGLKAKIPGIDKHSPMSLTVDRASSVGSLLLEDRNYSIDLQCDVI